MSNLLMKLFSQHPKIMQTDYPIMWAFLCGPERIAITPPDDFEGPHVQENYERFKDLTFQVSLDKLEQFIADAEKQVRLQL